jgi:hypothetical protein
MKVARPFEIGRGRGHNPMETSSLAVARELALGLIVAVVDFKKPEPFRQLSDFANKSGLGDEAKEFLFATFREYWASLKQIAASTQAGRIATPIETLAGAAPVNRQNRTLQPSRQPQSWEPGTTIGG